MPPTERVELSRIASGLDPTGHLASIELLSERERERRDFRSKHVTATVRISVCRRSERHRERVSERERVRVCLGEWFVYMCLCVCVIKMARRLPRPKSECSTRSHDLLAKCMPATFTKHN